MHNPRFLLLGCFILAAPAPAHGQNRDAATAEALFGQGRRAMDARSFREACPRFAESQKLDPAAGTLMNLATCEEKLGKLASAWQHWKEALDSLAPKDDRIPFAQSRVDDLEKRLPRLRISLARDSGTGAKVFRDETELGAAGQGVLLPVDPGPHLVTVRMPGHLVEKVTVVLAESEEKQIVVHPGPAELAADPRVGGETLPRTLGWVTGGIGVAGIGTGVVTGIMLANANSTVEANCTGKICTNQRGIDAASSGQTLLLVNAAAWIVGATGIGLGAYLLLSSSADRPTTAVVPSVTPDGAALSYVGRF
jgi:hypothetical protein